MSDSPADQNANEPAAAKPTRRQLIAGIAALVAGAAAKPAHEAEADTGDFISIDTQNQAADTTQLTRLAYTSGLPIPDGFVLQVGALPSLGGPAILGQAGLGATTATVTFTSAVGVVGLGRTGLVAGAGQARFGTHVRQIADHAGGFDSGAVIFNDDDAGRGLMAYQGPGLLNVQVTITAQPAAIHGLTFMPDSVAGVFEHGDNGTAILALGDVDIRGRLSATEGAGPSACGRATIPIGMTAFNINNAAITLDSFFVVTLLGQAGRVDAPITYSHVVLSAGRARVYLTGAAVRNTPVAWATFDC